MKAEKQSRAGTESQPEVRGATPPRRQQTGQEIPSAGLLLPPNLEFMELERTYTVA